DSLLLHQDMSRNIVLQPGDTLMIPEETNNKVFVVGDVPNPGVFTLAGDMTTLQVIAMAGGPVQRGTGTARTAYVLRRPSDSPGVVAGPPKTGTPATSGNPISVDLQAAMRGGDAGHDVPVQPGDVIVVPQTGMARLQAFLTLLAGWIGPLWFLK